MVKTSTIRGFLHAVFHRLAEADAAALAALCRRADVPARMAAHHPDRRRDQLRARRRDRARRRTLVKGYSDTHERGRQRYDMLMQMLPQIMETPDPAATLAALAQGRARRRHRRGALGRDQGHAPAVAGGGVAVCKPKLAATCCAPPLAGEGHAAQRQEWVRGAPIGNAAPLTHPICARSDALSRQGRGRIRSARERHNLTQSNSAGALERQSTAVASISSRASGSNSRPTWTSAIAGKWSPSTAR